MYIARILGIAILAVGIVFLALGIHGTHQTGQKIAEEFTGQYSDRIVGYIIAGSALIVAGTALLFAKRKLK